ncbi:MAG: sce7725 family protein [Planctomycetes bacterium]|nr:sce7725 family protein [Planctomycetota bacterium]
MYYPYFRGKQYELITVRESASLLASSGFVPIIEPVREHLSGLEKALKSLAKHNAASIIIANPQLGDHRDDGEKLRTFIGDNFADYQQLQIGCLLTEEMKKEDALEECKRHDSNRDIALIHAGFSGAKSLGEIVQQELPNVATNVFLEDYCGKLYQRHFKKLGTNVLVRDGYVARKRNRDHPDRPEFFSDLHITYPDENVDGFGDFLMVGDDFPEGGGRAYTVAIHLTFIDSDNDDAMHIQHFKSDRQDTPIDPAGKFQEALIKLVAAVQEPGSKFYKTEAVDEFCDLHDRGHFPGLGYVKKLSMKHHIETLAKFFEISETEK